MGAGLGLLIGHKGTRLRDVGARARAQIEPLRLMARSTANSVTRRIPARSR